MAKCANCANEAFYTYALTVDFGIDYCSRHVPRFLQNQKVSGMLPLREQVVVVEPEAPVVEAVLAEDVPVTPKKTTTRKKTVS